MFIYNNISNTERMHSIKTGREGCREGGLTGGKNAAPRVYMDVIQGKLPEGMDGLRYGGGSSELVWVRDSQDSVKCYFFWHYEFSYQ